MTETIPHEKEIITEAEALAKTTQNQTPQPDTPTKADIILKMVEERTKLEQYRTALLEGKRRPSALMKAVCYITQLIMSANKIILDAMRDNIQITAGHIDIQTEINELIKISREPECNKSNESQP